MPIKSIAPSVLIILDGWGHRSQTQHNAIAQAHLPHWNHLQETCPHTLLSSSGLDVGLPERQMGNSEVGHMNIGAGRTVYQPMTRINTAINNGSFRSNPILNQALKACEAPDTALHILGLVSPGGVHSHESQIAELCQWAKEKNLAQVYLHAFLDGRDTPPESAEASLEKFNTLLGNHDHCRIASITGRFYAMDRDSRWDRIARAYNLLTSGEADYQSPNAIEALKAAYARAETDEFVSPTVIGDAPAIIGDGDSVIFMNFRADRARQLSQALTQSSFQGFTRKRQPTLSEFVTLTDYSETLEAAVAFPADPLSNTLGEVLSKQGLSQLRIAETEKYAHVTFFLNGGVESVFPKEQRLLIPSPTQVRTYDEKPEMSAFEVTDRLVQAIEQNQFDVIICNFANTDMVGHTGNFAAAVKAAEAVDVCLSRITRSLKKIGGQCLITADHGNAELMVDISTGQPHTAHTCEPVPLIYIGPQSIALRQKGTLADIAPTMLQLMGIKQPKEMTGKTLIV